MANPALIVAVKGNIDDLTAKMKEGAVEIARVEGAAKSVTAAVAPMATTVQTAGTHVTGLKGAMESFDGILASVGIHMGPQIRGLGELGEAAKQGAGGLGMVASAGLVVGAAMAGWNLGRAAMEFFGLDQAVEKTWASLLGLGNAAEEAAGAKFDAIQLAFVKTGVHAQNATEALALMTTFLRGPLSEQLAAAEAAVAKLTAEQRKQIDAGLALGTSHALIAVSTHTTVAIVDMYVAATGRATKATKDREQAEKERAAALKVWLDDEMKAQDAAFELEERLRHLGQAHRQAEADDKKKKTAEVNATVLAGHQQIEDAVGKLRDFTMKASLDESSYQIVKIYETADATVRAFKGSEEERARFTKAVMDLADLEASHVTYAATTSMQQISVEAQRLEDNIQRIIAGLAPIDAAAAPAGQVPSWYAQPVSGPFGVGGTPTPAYMGAGPAHNPNPGLYGGPPTTFFHYAEGVRNAPGGWSTVGERGAETMYVPPGADIYPSGSSSGGGIRDVHVHVGGNILGTQYELAQLVKAAIKADDRSRGRVG